MRDAARTANFAENLKEDMEAPLFIGAPLLARVPTREKQDCVSAQKLK
jgi:hypothetical protein